MNIKNIKKQRINKILTIKKAEESDKELYGVDPNFSVIEESSFISNYLRTQSNPKKWLKRFIDINSDILAKDTPVKSLGKGSLGEAFLTEDGNIFKIFISIDALNFYKEEMRAYKEGDSNALEVYDYGVFRMPENTEYTPIMPLWTQDRSLNFIGWAIMERLETSADIQKRINEKNENKKYSNSFIIFLYNIIDQAKVYASLRIYDYPEDPKELDTFLGRKAQDLFDSKVKDEDGPLHKSWVQLKDTKGFPDEKFFIDTIKQTFRSYIKSRTDLKEDNLGFRDNKPIYFDPKAPNLMEIFDVEDQYQDEIYWDELPDANLSDDPATPKMPDFDFIYKSKIVNELAKRADNPSAWIDRFVDLNSDIFIKDLPVKKLGSGYFGETWETENGNVFKLFRGIGALRFYEQEEHRATLPNEESVLDVIDYGVIRMPEGIRYSERSALGWAIVEKLDTELYFQQDVYQALFFEKLADDAEDMYYEMKKENAEKGIIPTFSDYDLNILVTKLLVDVYDGGNPYYRGRKTPSVYLIPSVVMSNFIRAVVKNIQLSRVDLSAENVGYKGFDVTFFDPFNPRDIDTKQYYDKHKEEIRWDEQENKKEASRSIAYEPSEGILPDFSILEESELLEDMAYDFTKYHVEEWIHELIEYNSDVFAKYKPVKLLGSGSYGEVYLTEDGNVLKIFRSIGHIKFYEDSLKREYAVSEGNHLHIIDYGPLRMPKIGEPVDGDEAMGWVVMEKLDSPREYLKRKLKDILIEKGDFSSTYTLPPDAIRFFENLISHIYTKINYLEEDNLSRENLEENVDKLFFNIASSYREYSLFDYILNIVGEETFKNIIREALLKSIQGYSDMYAQNMGFRGEKPIYFDAFIPKKTEDQIYFDKFQDEILWAEEDVEDKNMSDDSLKENPLFNPEMPNFETLSNSYFLKNLANKLAGEKSKEWMERFIDLNSDVFAKDMPVENIGSGFYGDAWLTENGNVLKMFKNIGHLKFYQESQNKEYEGKDGNILHVIDYGLFRMPEGSGLRYKSDLIGWALVEKLDTVEEYFVREIKDSVLKEKNLVLNKPDIDYFLIAEIQELINSIYNLANLYFNSRNRNSDLDKKELADKVSERVFRELSLKRYFQEAIRFLGEEKFKEIIDYITQNLTIGFSDMYSKNLGFREDKPIFFDPYVPSTRDLRDSYDENKKAIFEDYLEEEVPEMQNFSSDSKTALPSEGEIPDFSNIYNSSFLHRIAARYSGYEARGEWINRFIDINSDIFVKDMPVRELGSGYYGEAWLTENGNVFKMFEDVAHLKFYEESQNKEYKGEDGNILHVIDYGVFRIPKTKAVSEIDQIRGEKNRTLIGWAIIEKLQTTREHASEVKEDRLFKEKGVAKKRTPYRKYVIDSEEIKTLEFIVNKATFIAKDFISRVENSDSFKYADNKVEIVSAFTFEKLINDIRNKFDSTFLSQKRIREIVHEVAKKLVEDEYTDLFSNNLGFRGTKPIYFDPYIPNYKDQEHYEKLYHNQIFEDFDTENFADDKKEVHLPKTYPRAFRNWLVSTYYKNKIDWRAAPKYRHIRANWLFKNETDATKKKIYLAWIDAFPPPEEKEEPKEKTRERKPEGIKSLLYKKDKKTKKKKDTGQLGLFDKDASMKNPIKTNNDYQGNFVDKVRKRLKRKKKRKIQKEALRSLLSGEKVVSRGDDSPEAKMLQEKLSEEGYLTPEEISGYFDNSSDKALRDYQKDNGLIEDGIGGEWVAGKILNKIPDDIAEPVEVLEYNGENISPLAAKYGISPLFLKALLEVSGHKPDIYMDAWFKANPKAVTAANNLDFKEFSEYYFGYHYVEKGIHEELQNKYNEIKENNPEFKRESE